MELIRGLHNLRPRHRGCVATIGNFDGLHRGHRAVVAQTCAHAAAAGVPALVMLFEPQPQEFFQAAAAPARLSRLREKIEGLRALGIDRVLCLRFDARLAEFSPARFIDDILVRGIGAREVIVGEDFRFGHKRAGDIAVLRAAGAAAGFSVTPMTTVTIDGARASSTRVRQLLARGELAAAAGVLGAPYRISGRVAHGDKRGRTIGVPTANIALRRRVAALRGVYIVNVYGLAQPARGVANIGTRPTVDGTRSVLEVHIFDHSEEIYGRPLQIEFLHKLRDEQRFDSFAELKLRISQDMTEARTWLRQAG